MATAAIARGKDINFAWEGKDKSGKVMRGEMRAPGEAMVNATLMKAGVPLLQSFDIVGKGHANPAVARLLMALKTDVETGSALAAAFRKYPLYFDALFCNLVAAGEQAGILETLLDRLANYKEKILAIKSKIKAALFYPIAIIVVAFIITAVIMIFVIPAFKEVFSIFVCVL